MNFTVLLDDFMAEEFKTLSPHYNIPDMSKPYSVSGNLTLNSPANNIISNWLSDKTDNPEEDIITAQLTFKN